MATAKNIVSTLRLAIAAHDKAMDHLAKSAEQSVKSSQYMASCLDGLLALGTKPKVAKAVQVEMTVHPEEASKARAKAMKGVTPADLVEVDGGFEVDHAKVAKRRAKAVQPKAASKAEQFTWNGKTVTMAVFDKPGKFMPKNSLYRKAWKGKAGGRITILKCEDGVYRTVRANDAREAGLFG